MEAPAVSVLIPCYNREEFVREAIESVSAQTFRDWELIVIDDGSTDRSLDVIRSTIDANEISRASVVSRENRGLVATTIEGFEMARGRYFAFLDSDDRWEPEKLEAQVREIEEAGSGCGACFADAWVIDAGGRRMGRLGSSHPYRGGHILLDLVLSRFVPPNPTAVFRSDAIRDVGGFDSKAFFQDLPLWLRIARSHEIRYVNRPLASYRVHQSNMGRRNVEAVFRATLDQIEGALARSPELERYRGRALARVHARFAGAFFNDLDLSRARREAARAIALYPFDRIAWRILVGSVLGRNVVRAIRTMRQRSREERGFLP